MTLPPSAPTLPSPQVVDALATDLRRLQELAKLELAIESGRLIVERLYDGVVENLHHHGRTRAGLRVLAAHPDVSVPVSTLHGYVAVYSLTTRVRVIEAERALSYSHYKAVLRLPEDKQQPLLQQAANEGWSVAELQQETEIIKPLRQRNPPPTRKASATTIVRAFTRPLGVHRERLHDPRLTATLTRSRKQLLAEALTPVIEALQRLQADLLDQPQPRPEPAPAPTPASPIAPSPSPTDAPTRTPPPARTPSPTVQPEPAQPAVRPKPPGPTASSEPDSIEERLKASAARCYALLQVIGAGVSDDRLVQTLARRAHISIELAEQIALLRKLPERWRERLNDPRTASNHTLAELLRAARLLEH